MFSTNLFKIDLDKKEILEQIIPAESVGYGGSLAIISPSNADKPDIIVTVDPKILLYLVEPLIILNVIWARNMEDAPSPYRKEIEIITFVLTHRVVDTYITNVINQFVAKL